MQLTGNRILNAGPAKVWEMLMNPDSLARIVPGISSLEMISGNSYITTLNIKIGPVNSTFSGKLQIEDIIEQKSFTLKTQQSSKIGNGNATLQIKLAPSQDNQTELAFDGDVKLSGMLATMGQRIVSGVANTLTNQFFNNIQKELTVTTDL